MRKAYFEKPALELDGKKLIAVFTAHNEAERIPYFLDYYRQQGVQHFLAIDNNSTDHTKKLLADQKDVTYFFTPSSYVESKAGRLWTSELANHYCVGKWVLTLDLDEILVFPGSEHLQISQLCDYMDQFQFEGLFTVFLDMYSSKPLSEAICEPGRPFQQVCDHFDVDSYSLKRPSNFPLVQVHGGPRQRLFWQEGKSGQGPSMRKMPLVKWQKGFRYIFSTHSSTPIRLADVTGALLHFKFFSSFKSLAEREVARGDRVQKADYEKYARLVKEQDISFMTPQSVRYESSTTLLDRGVIVAPARYLSRMKRHLTRTLDKDAAAEADRQLRQVSADAFERAALGLKHFPFIWGLLGRTSDSGVLCVRDRSIVGYYNDILFSRPFVNITARDHHSQAGQGEAHGFRGPPVRPRPVRVRPCADPPGGAGERPGQRRRRGLQRRHRQAARLGVRQRRSAEECHSVDHDRRPFLAPDPGRHLSRGTEKT
jgi:Glycosyl transferase family 2